MKVSEIDPEFCKVVLIAVEDSSTSAAQRSEEVLNMTSKILQLAMKKGRPRTDDRCLDEAA